SQPEQPEVATQWGILDNVLNAEESTLQFLRDVFDEVIELFPSRHIGVGGDECPTGPWETSERASTRIAELGLPNADGLRFWYVARLAEHLATRGRLLYGWDEICDGELPPDAVVASWRGTAGAVTTWCSAPRTRSTSTGASRTIPASRPPSARSPRWRMSTLSKPSPRR